MLLHAKQRQHPTPTLQGESCVNLIISKTIGKTSKTKTTKEVKAKTIKNHWGNQKNKTTKTFGPMTLFGDISPKVLFLFFPMFLTVFALASLVVLFVWVFLMVFDIFNLVHGQTR